RLAIQTRQAMVERTRQLVESRAGAQNDLIVAESELAEAKLAAHAAGAKLSSLQIAQSGDTTYWVLATRSGTVVQLDAAPGKQVGPDKDKPVATVADLDEVLVLGDVPQRDAVMLTAGMKALVSFAGSTSAPIEGVVETVSEVVDPERQTVPIRVRVKTGERKLRPNAYVDLTFTPSGDAPVVQVPAEAVVSDGAASVVFVETEPGVFRRRPVQLGRQTKEKAEIASGLAAGERVVTSGALLLLNSLDVQG
ncbi:MAG: efflux RND transporter periplasmic adaptor subunit, partial [Byssovorax sp.]